MQKDAIYKGLVGYWDFGESKHPPCTGIDHEGEDWVVEDGNTISGVHCNISRFVVPKSATVNVAPYNGSFFSGKLEVYAVVSLLFI